LKRVVLIQARTLVEENDPRLTLIDHSLGDIPNV